MTGGNNTTTSGSAGQGSRAVDAALSAKAPFRPRVGDKAMRVGARHAERWAPEGQAAKRSRALGALTFADTILSPYVKQASQFARNDMFGAAPGVVGAVEREIEPTSWVFPRPWYMDELAWLTAARAMSSGYHPSVSTSRAQPVTRGRAPVGATSVGTPLPLELIAPSYVGAARSPDVFSGRASSPVLSAFRSSGRVSDSTAAGASRGSGIRLESARTSNSSLRAWSPLVSFPAAQAAEVMQAVARSSSTERISPTIADEAWTLFEYVAPSDVTEREHEMHVSERVRVRMERAVARAAQRREALVAARPTSSTVESGTPLPSSQRGESAEASSEAPLATAGASPGSRQAPVPTSAVELLRRAIASGGAAIEPVAGPRVALPSGLGGAVIGLHTSHSLSRPLAARIARADASAYTVQARPFATIPAVASAVSPARVTASIARNEAAARSFDLPLQDISTPLSFAEPLAGGTSELRPVKSAYRAVAGQRPRGMQHLAWSDHWLARFAGASASTLARLDASTGSAPLEVLSSESMTRNAPTPVFISPGVFAPDMQTLAARTATTTLALAAAHVIVPPSMRPAVASQAAGVVRSERSAAQPGTPSQKSGQRSAPTAAPVIGDNESVSDEVFAAIAAARAVPASAEARREASRTRDRREQQIQEREQARRTGAQTERARHMLAAAPGSDPTASAGNKRIVVGRSLVDRLLDFGPVAPGPGMRSALAASPVAPALNAVVPLPATRSFDVRAVSGDSLAYAYLLGAVEPEMRFVGPSERAAMMRSLFASPDPQISLGRTVSMDVHGDATGDDASRRNVLGKLALAAPEAVFVAPDEPASAASTESVTDAFVDKGVRPSSFPRPADPAAGAFRAASAQAGMTVGDSTVVPRQSVSAGRALPSTMPPVALDVVSPLFPSAEIRALQLSALSPLSRTASVAAAASSALTTPTLGLSTTEAMTRLTGGGGYAYGPGQAGTRAHAWSVAHERASADLAFDFVAPELVSAARIYGFGPAEASQASRLSVAGPGGLTSLASAVDLTFIDTFEDVHSHRMHASGSIRAREAARVDVALVGGMRSSSMVPAGVSEIQSSSGGDVSRVELGAGTTSGMDPAAATAPISYPDMSHTAMPRASESLTAGAATAAMRGAAPASPAWLRIFGGARGGRMAPDSTASLSLYQTPFVTAGRRPRGAFLWPKAALSALGLDSIDTGDEPPVSLAALDLLAARAVANVGVFVAPDGTPMTLAANDTAVPVRSERSIPSRTSASTDGTAENGQLTSGPAAATPPTTVAATYADSARQVLVGMGIPVDSPEEAVAIVSTVGTSRVPREFNALYVALSRSSAGRSMSPAVRAARALALSQSFDSGTASSARARAAAAWAVMPMVIPSVDYGQGASSEEMRGEDSSGTSYQPSMMGGGVSGALTGMPSAIRPDAYRPAGGLEAVYLVGTDWAGANNTTIPGATTTPRSAVGTGESRLAVGRAGESLRSFVTPYSEYQQPKTSARAQSDSRGALMRAPTAAQPLVQTGGSASLVAPERAAMQQMISAARSKRASGDVGMPSWFEKAARRMFEDSSDGGISLAEMTLVATAPVSQVAASPKTASASPAAAPTNAGGTENEGAQAAPDVEALAMEVYTEIVRLMEISRERNGEPWR